MAWLDFVLSLIGPTREQFYSVEVLFIPSSLHTGWKEHFRRARKKPAPLALHTTALITGPWPLGQ